MVSLMVSLMVFLCAVSHGVSLGVPPGVSHGVPMRFYGVSPVVLHDVPMVSPRCPSWRSYALPMVYTSSNIDSNLNAGFCPG